MFTHFTKLSIDISFVEWIQYAESTPPPITELDSHILIMHKLTMAHSSTLQNLISTFTFWIGHNSTIYHTLIANWKINIFRHALQFQNLFLHDTKLNINNSFLEWIQLSECISFIQQAWITCPWIIQQHYNIWFPE